MLKNSEFCMLALALVFTMLNANAAEKIGSSKSPQSDDMVRSVLMHLESAMASKNVGDATALFTEDVHTIDQYGEEVRGLQQLRERFQRRAAASPSVGIHPQSITFPAATVALVLGEVSRKSGQEDLPTSRFSMLLVKQNNNWLINEVQETTMQPAPAASRLQELNWLIGQWSADKTDVSAQLDFEWTPDKKFIKSKCTLNKDGKQPEIDNQIIGWDPQRNTIVSWHFDSTGGFGSGTWSKQTDENKWTIAVAGVSPDGSNSQASNVFTMKSQDEFVWQSVHRTLNGEPIDDTAAITVQKIKR